MPKLGISTVFAVLVLLAAPTTATPATWYVSASAGSDNNAGDSTEDAWETLDRAFGSACACLSCGNLPQSGDVVLVAPGTYSLCGELDFIGGVTLKSEAGASETIVQAASGHRHALLDGTGSGTAIGGLGNTGFTFTGGDLPNVTTPFDGGGAIKVIGGSTATIQSCVFLGNNVTDGVGGALCYKAMSGGQLILRDCDFLNNTVTYESFESGQSQIGGAGAFVAGASPEISSCHFEANAVVGADFDVQAGSASVGGGLYWRDMTGGGLVGCVFVGNSAREGGALQLHVTSNVPDAVSYNGFYNNSATKNGGGANVFHGTWAIDHCTFVRNTALNRGGALFTEHGRSVDRCVFSENSATGDGSAGREGVGGAIYATGASLDLTGCEISRCTARAGGGVYWSGSGSPTSTWSHVTFVGNVATAGKAGGAFLRGGTSPNHPIDLECTNSIFALNLCSDSGSTLGAAFHENNTAVGLVRSCMSLYENDPEFPEQAPCDNCIRDDDPLFCADAVDGYGIQPNSPAADPPVACDEYLGSQGICTAAIAASEDTEIRETNQTTGFYVGGDTLRVGNQPGSGYTTILRFKKSDFSAITSSSTVLGAYLDLYALPNQVSGVPQVRSHSGFRTSTVLSQTNWYQWRSSHGWGLHGARDAFADYDGRAILGVQDEWPSAVGGQVSLARGGQLAKWFADYVQPGGSHASLSSYVYLLLHVVPTAGTSGRVGFSSKDGGLPPRLTITYEE